MIWLLSLLVLVLIAVALALWMKRGASNINDYFCDAVTAYTLAGEDAARIAALTAAKVAASQQRASMLLYLRGMASDWERLTDEDIKDIIPLVRRRLAELADEIEAKDWNMGDIWTQKEILGRTNAEYLAALDKCDPGVFRKKWPSLFDSEKVQALKALQKILLKSAELTPEGKAIVKSPIKLHDIVTIPSDAMQIIGEYGQVVAEDKRLLKPFSILPYPKETIKQAIETALQYTQDPEIRQHLHTLLDVLCDFVPDEKVPQDREENVKAWLMNRAGRAL